MLNVQNSEYGVTGSATRNPGSKSPVSSSPNLIACHECDQLQREIALPVGGAALCCRCGAVLYRNNIGALDRSLALLLAAAILFVLANAYPIVSIEVQGNRSTTTLFGAVMSLWQQDMPLIAGLVFFTAILAPAFELAISIAVLTALRLRWSFIGLPVLLRLLLSAEPWSMVEVFMLGVLVAVVKLSHLTTIVPGIALWAYALLIVLMAASAATLSARDLWLRVSVR